MKKLLTTITITAALALPVAVSADPDRGGSNLPHMAVRDGVLVSYRGGRECELTTQDRFVIREDISVEDIVRTRVDSVRIRVYSGPNENCSGDVRRHEIRRAPNRVAFQEAPIVEAEQVSNTDEGVLVQDTKLFMYDFNVLRNEGRTCKVRRGNKVIVSQRKSMSGVSLIRLQLNENPFNCQGWTREIENFEGEHSIFSAGKWGEYVPIFRDQKSYFNARDKEIIENVVCRARVGSKLDMLDHYRDWGLSEVRIKDCRGWIDRGVVR